MHHMQVGGITISLKLACLVLECNVVKYGVVWTQSDGWTGIEEELEMAGFMVAARVFSTFVIILGNFIFTQTVVAIILLNIDYATAKFKASNKYNDTNNN